MNETGNVCGAVLHDYSKFFNKLSKVGTFLKNEFIYGGHWLSLGGSAFSVSIMLMLNAIFRLELFFIVYFLSIFVYNFDHFIDLNKDQDDNPKRTNHLKKYKKLFPIILTIYGSSFVGLLCFFGNIPSLLVVLIIMFIGILYSIGLKNLTKKIVGFKNIYTSLSVSLIVIFIAFYYSIPLNFSVIIIFVFVFLCFLVNTSFCDIKDMKTDKKQNLLTLPLYFGKIKFLSILHLLNIFTFLLLAVSIIAGSIPFFASGLLISFFYCFYYIQKAKSSKIDIQKLSSYIADGEFVLWPLILVIGLLVIV